MIRLFCQQPTDVWTAGPNAERPVNWFAPLVGCLLLALCGAHCDTVVHAQEPHQYDLVVYGATSAGVMAAVQARRSGLDVVVVGPDRHLGGLSASGLGWTDTGNKAVIGGLAREFYHRLWKYYQSDDAWRWQKRSDYGNRGQGTPAVDGALRTMWIFEPHAAEAVFEEMIREAGIVVHRERWLDREHGVTLTGRRIASIRMLDGEVFRGSMFIDATYEGDLMAAAGVSHHVGREANSQYNETWNGVQAGTFHHAHHFKPGISAYRIPGVPASGLLPRISDQPPGEKGTADRRVQAYCYRVCLTNHAPNRVPFPKPAGYDPGEYELLARVLESGWNGYFQKFDPIPNFKTDTNNHGPFSTDNIGMNYDYPAASYERRQQILDEHRQYQQGLHYFMANDDRVPVDIREASAQWGLSRDEFADNGNWPHQIYVREARRLVGAYVMTEHDCLDRKETPEPVGMGSYTLDSHNVQRHVDAGGFVQNEGDIGIQVPRPYEISYRALIPKNNECENLLVPVCVSSSHIAYGSIRMEPVFMILAQSAAEAAAIAIEQQSSVQAVDYDRLARRLRAAGQVLEIQDATALWTADLPGIVVDDLAAVLEGGWVNSTSVAPFIGIGYRHDNNDKTRLLTAVFETELPTAGRYELRVACSAHPNRASNVAWEIQTAHGLSRIVQDQRVAPPHGAWHSLGQFEFGKKAEVSVSNRDTDGFVVIDAVQWLMAK